MELQEKIGKENGNCIFEWNLRKYCNEVHKVYVYQELNILNLHSNYFSIIPK